MRDTEKKREYDREYMRKYRASPEGKIKIKKIARKHMLKRRYNMSIEDKEKLINLQNNRCKICNMEFTDSKSICTDHNHETDKVRGLLCHPCNLILGLSKENIVTLVNAIKYLEENKEE